MHPGKLLIKTASEVPDKLAVIEDERRVTNKELLTRATVLAARLREQGCGKGCAVVLFLPNSMEFVVSYFAVMLLGGVVAPADVRLAAPELAAFIGATRPGAVLTTAQHKQVANDAAGRLAFDVEVVDVRGLLDGAEGMDSSVDGFEVEEVLPGDDALYLGTSGTTGARHVVVLTYLQLDLFPETMHAVLDTSESDVIGMILPMSHISGPIVCNEAVLRRNPIVLLDVSQPEKAISMIERHKVTWFHGVPAIFQVIFRQAKGQPSRLRSLRFVAMMGTIVPVPVLREFSECAPNTAVLQGYGATETSPLVLLMRTEDARRKIGSVGKPTPRCEVKVVDDGGQELPAGQIGEIVVRGPHVMKGYLNDPKATAEVIKDGWYHTRDAGYFDDEGFFYIVGRKDDMIITGGLNVHPGEVENVLLEHPAVFEAAVFAVPHKLRGVILKAAVVLKSGYRTKEGEILAFCRERLADFKVPRQIEFREALPRTKMGKIDRRSLTAQA